MEPVPNNGMNFEALNLDYLDYWSASSILNKTD